MPEGPGCEVAKGVNTDPHGRGGNYQAEEPIKDCQVTPVEMGLVALSRPHSISLTLFEYPVPEHI